MKWLLGAALTLAVLAALALGAALLFLPDLLAGEAARARIESAAESALGRPLRYERLEVGLLPPSLVVVEPRVAGSAPEQPPLAEARRVSLRVALLPLLARQLQIEGLVVDGATLRLRRSAAGFELPLPAEPEGAPQTEPVGAAASELPELAIRKLLLRDTTLILEDAAAQLAGTLSGELEVEGLARSPDRIRARLALRDADVRFERISLRGPLRVEADLSGGLAAPSGRFDIDATQAELGYGRAFRKPAGIPATVGGRLVSGPGGVLGFDDLELRVRDLDASAELSGGERMRMDLRAPPFDLSGWETMLPALAGWQLGGRVAPGALALERSPTELHGRIELDGVEATSPHGGTLVLRGALLGEGPRLRSEGLEVLAADQSFRFDAELADLGVPEARWRLRFEARDADLRPLMAGFTGVRDELRGQLSTDGDLTLPLDGGADLLSSLAGRVRLEIREGSTTGRSLLSTSLDALVAVAQPLELLKRGLDIGGRKRSADRFESVTGSFEIAGGLARTSDLRIIERDHSIDLSGTLRLADLALDMVGKLTFAGTRDDEPGGVRQGIPLAHVGGTLGDPRVEVSADAARSFAAALQPGRLGAKLERALGSDGVRELKDGLGGLLDKASRKRR